MSSILNHLFSGVQNIVNYPARYSHRVAISNHRIVYISDMKVHFCYGDYTDQSRQKVMRLKGELFLQQFYLHILPVRFYQPDLEKLDTTVFYRIA